MKKKVIKTIILMIIIYLVFIYTNVYAITGTVIEETVRIREEASTDSNTVLLVAEGSEVEILSQEGDWYEIEYASDGITYTGYIRSDMLDVDESEETTNETTEEDTEKEETTDEDAEQEETENDSAEVLSEGDKITITSELETRLLPLITAQITETIAAETEIEVIEIIGNWTHVETSSTSGWVLTSKLEIK